MFYFFANIFFTIIFDFFIIKLNVVKFIATTIQSINNRKNYGWNTNPISNNPNGNKSK